MSTLTMMTLTAIDARFTLNHHHHKVIVRDILVAIKYFATKKSPSQDLDTGYKIHKGKHIRHLIPIK